MPRVDFAKKAFKIRTMIHHGFLLIQTQIHMHRKAAQK